LITTTPDGFRLDASLSKQLLYLALEKSRDHGSKPRKVCRNVNGSPIKVWCTRLPRFQARMGRHGHVNATKDLLLAGAENYYNIWD
jgi:hypothetical protein